MDLQNRKPERSQAPVQVKPAAAAAGKTKSNLVLTISSAVIAAALVVFGALYFTVFNKVGGEAVKSDQYQAVFLTNGQVYFGKLTNVGAEYVNLEDVFYLQVDRQIQPTGGDDEAADSANDNSGVKLIKLGNEIHGPEDSMQISSDQVLFWENLKNDGKVAEAIEGYQK